MQTPLCLTPSVHAVRIGDDIVLLDVMADQYLCLPGGAALGLSDDRRRLQACDVALGEELAAAGLVMSGEGAPACAGHATLAQATSDLCRPSDHRVRLRDALSLGRASVDAAWRYPRQTFADLVAFAATRTGETSPDQEPAAEVQALVGGFHRWACWMPAPSKCLIRSFVLLRLLRRRGFDARWVFAVKTWPFEAHCWLQSGTVILDDVPDRLAAYHPILVV